MTADEPTPDQYQRYRIDEVRREGDGMVIQYGGRIFAGVMPELIEAYGIQKAVQPGAEILVRYHTDETGRPGQVAHMLIRHPDQDGWAEIYADWV